MKGSPVRVRASALPDLQVFPEINSLPSRNRLEHLRNAAPGERHFAELSRTVMEHIRNTVLSRCWVPLSRTLGPAGSGHA